jgi:hypothetical protein
MGTWTGFQIFDSQPPPALNQILIAMIGCCIACSATSCQPSAVDIENIEKEGKVPSGRTPDAARSAAVEAGKSKYTEVEKAQLMATASITASMDAVKLPNDPTGNFYCQIGDHLVDGVVWAEQIACGCVGCMIRMADQIEKDSGWRPRLWKVTPDGISLTGTSTTNADTPPVHFNEAGQRVPLQTRPVEDKPVPEGYQRSWRTESVPMSRARVAPSKKSEAVDFTRYNSPAAYVKKHQDWTCGQCRNIYDNTMGGYLTVREGRQEFVCKNCAGARKLGTSKTTEVQRRAALTAKQKKLLLEKPKFRYEDVNRHHPNLAQGDWSCTRCRETRPGVTGAWSGLGFVCSECFEPAPPSMEDRRLEEIRISEEKIKKSIFTAQSMEEVKQKCDDFGMPYPPELLAYADKMDRLRESQSPFRGFDNWAVEKDSVVSFQETLADDFKTPVEVDPLTQALQSIKSAMDQLSTVQATPPAPEVGIRLQSKGSNHQIVQGSNSSIVRDAVPPGGYVSATGSNADVHIKGDVGVNAVVHAIGSNARIKVDGYIHADAVVLARGSNAQVEHHGIDPNGEALAEGSNARVIQPTRTAKARRNKPLVVRGTLQRGLTSQYTDPHTI